MASVNQARFTINSTPSEDPVTGDRLYQAINNETLTVTLEVNPSPALSAKFEVFDPAGPKSPLASKSAPLITWNENSLAAITIGPVPFGIDGDVTIDMPAAPIFPLTGIISYLIRCTVSTAGEGTQSTQEQVFERLVLIFSVNTTPPIRKTIPAESTEARARGWSDSINDLTDAMENVVASVSGTLQQAYNGGNTIDVSPANGPLLFRGTTAQATSPLQVQLDPGAGLLDVLTVDGLGGVTIEAIVNRDIAIGTTGTGILDLEGSAGAAITAVTGDLTIDAFVGDIILNTGGSPSITVDAAGDVGIGVPDPNQRVHVLTGGVSGFTAGANRGILITDSIGPRVVFEDAGEAAGARVMAIRYESQSLSIFSLNDVGNAVTADDIIVVNRDGNVGFGGVPGILAKFTVLQNNQNRISVDVSGRVELFSAPGEDVRILAGPRGDVLVRAGGPEVAGDFPGILTLEGGGGGDTGPGGGIDILGGPAKFISSNPGGPVNSIAGIGGGLDGTGGVGTVAGGPGGGIDGDGGLQIVRGGLGVGTGVDGELHLSAVGVITRVLGDLVVAGTATVGGSLVVVETRTLTAGAGLTGGGDLSANRTFDVLATDPSIVVSANSIGIGVLQSDVMHGLRGGGTQHPDVIAGGASGFMDGVRATKLDALILSEFATTGVLFDGTNPTRFLHTAGAGVFQTPTGATLIIPASAPTGTYEIGVDVEWGYDTATTNFLSQMLQSGVVVPIMEHEEEPADAGLSGPPGVVDGADMVMHLSRSRPISFTTGTAVTFTFQFAPEATADCAVRRLSLTIRRAA